MTMISLSLPFNYDFADNSAILDLLLEFRQISRSKFILLDLDTIVKILYKLLQIMLYTIESIKHYCLYICTCK